MKNKIAVKSRVAHQQFGEGTVVKRSWFGHKWKINFDNVKRVDSKKEYLTVDSSKLKLLVTIK